MAEATATPHRIGLTPIEMDCALFIQEYSDEHGFSPNLDEIREELELKSKSGAHRLVMQLVVKGWAVNRKAHTRSVRLLQRIPSPISMADPREVGQVAMEAIETLGMVCGWMSVSPEFKARVAALTVRLLEALGGTRPNIQLTEEGERKCLSA